jgi:hypothetical protein
MAVVIKTVGASGQISLGKKYAGRTVIIEQIEEHPPMETDLALLERQVEAGVKP